jgi:hypothetical protein
VTLTALSGLGTLFDAIAIGFDENFGSDKYSELLWL